MYGALRSRRTAVCDELALVTKPALEFFDVETVPWSPVAEQAGVSERVLASDPSSGLLTRMVRWDPGLDTSSLGSIAHDYVEEVLIVAGSLHDLSLGRTFGAGWYACRPPGMVHGPWTTSEGCVMFEVRYAAQHFARDAKAP
jgi:ChrR Cupin-like domain